MLGYDALQVHLADGAEQIDAVTLDGLGEQDRRFGWN